MALTEIARTLADGPAASFSGRVGPRHPEGHLVLRSTYGRPVIADQGRYRPAARAAADIARELGAKPGDEFAVSYRVDEGDPAVVVAVRGAEDIARSRTFPI